ncbi:MAG TPA: GNAT family N-acetyltransferase [Candidatus Deferrimicrobiaceae bacterium]
MKGLEFFLLRPEHEGLLGNLFEVLGDDTISRFFHPHLFTREEAGKRCRYGGGDLYYAIADGERFLGYGMLRGWDEGYEIPSLGIALHPEAQGKGLGRSFMHFLHAAARLRGAKRIRLKVHPENKAAVKLYESLGYRYPETSEGQLVGFLDL